MQAIMVRMHIVCLLIFHLTHKHWIDSVQGPQGADDFGCQMWQS